MKERGNNILVVQGRLDTEVIRREQTNIRNIAEKAQVHVTFVNPLLDKEWDKPDTLLRQHGGSMWLGSAEIDLPQITNVEEKYLDRALPLAQKITNNSEFAQGICLGHQVLSLAAGGTVNRLPQEVGTLQLNLTQEEQNNSLFRDVPLPSFKMIYGHQNSVETIPQGAVRLGSTESDPNSALKWDNIVTFQGHPEITDIRELKARIKKSTASEHEYLQTHPIEPPHATENIIIRFLHQVKKAHKRTNLHI
jgi:GMP synthase-like glutamine amidotransferase